MFISPINNFSYHSEYSKNKPAFNGQKEKFIEKFLAEKNVNNIKIKFPELENICKFLGFEEISKKGSHRIFQLNEDIIYSFPRPHGKNNELDRAQKKSFKELLSKYYVPKEKTASTDLTV